MSQVRTYRISPDEAAVRRRRAVRISVISALLTFFLPIFVTQWQRPQKLGSDFPPDSTLILLLIFYIGAMGALLTWIVWRNVRRAQAAVAQLLTIEIIVDESSVSWRQPGVQESRLPFSEIGRMEEYRIGLKICSRTPGSAILVPAGVERLDELKMLIRGASGAELISRKSLWNWGMLFVAGFLASMVTLMFAKQLVTLRAAALYVVGFMLVGTYQLFHNPNIQAKQKAKMALGLAILLSFVLARAVPLWPF